MGSADNLLAKEEEKKDNEVSPPEDLMREHGVLKRILLVYGEALRRMDANQDLPPEPIRESAKIIRSFVEDYHEKLGRRRILQGGGSCRWHRKEARHLRTVTVHAEGLMQ